MKGVFKEIVDSVCALAAIAILFGMTVHTVHLFGQSAGWEWAADNLFWINGWVPALAGFWLVVLGMTFLGLGVLMPKILDWPEPRPPEEKRYGRMFSAVLFFAGAFIVEEIIRLYPLPISLFVACVAASPLVILLFPEEQEEVRNGTQRI